MHGYPTHTPVHVEESVSERNGYTARLPNSRTSRRISTRVNARWPVGTRVANTFDGVVYSASVTRIRKATKKYGQLWHVVYEDTDEADLDEKEMEHARKLYLDGVLDDDDGGDGESDHSSSGDEYDP